MKTERENESTDTAAERGSYLPNAIFGFDRIDLWIDQPDLNITAISTHCGDIRTEVKQMHYQARWKLKLTLLQPSAEAIRILAVKLGNEIAVLINYVEIACDSRTGSRRTARVLKDQFLRSACIPYQRQEVLRDKSIWYYGRRSDGRGKRKRIVVLYCDKPSKLNNARPADDGKACCHWECRLTGSPTLEHVGIVSLSDLISFNHQRFWDDTLRFYRMPKKVSLGRMLAAEAGANLDVSGTALRKRANRWISLHSIDDKFVMHNALLRKRGIARRLETVSVVDWLKSATEAAMAE